MRIALALYIPMCAHARARAVLTRGPKTDADFRQEKGEKRASIYARKKTPRRTRRFSRLPATRIHICLIRINVRSGCECVCVHATRDHYRVYMTYTTYICVIFLFFSFPSQAIRAYGLGAGRERKFYDDPAVVADAKHVLFINITNARGCVFGGESHIPRVFYNV